MERTYPFFSYRPSDSWLVNKFIETKVTFDTLDTFAKESLEDLHPAIYRMYKEDTSKSTAERIKEYYAAKKSLSLVLPKTPDEESFLSNLYSYLTKSRSGTVIYSQATSEAPIISDGELLHHMTQQDGVIYPLYKSARGSKVIVKPYLPTIAFSNNSRNRDKTRTEITHTGVFVFDFDKLGSPDKARVFLNRMKVELGNLLPFMLFISPSGAGVKLLVQFDVNHSGFINDFLRDKSRESVQRKHKELYASMMNYIIKQMPDAEKYFDSATSDVERMTYIPYLEFPELDLFYNPTQVCDYEFFNNLAEEIVKENKQKELLKFSKPIAKYKKKVDCTGLSEEEILLRVKDLERRKNFDPTYELERLRATIDTLLEIASGNSNVRLWMDEAFTSYHTLHKQAWVLYGCFGDEGIEELKRCIPSNSNKLDEGTEDSRWARVNESHYSQDQLMTMTPGSFYALIRTVPELKESLDAHYKLGSRQVNDFQGIMDSYDDFSKMEAEVMEGIVAKEELDNLEFDFMDKITDYLDVDHPQLPIIEDLDTLETQMKLGPKDYLNKEELTKLLQVTYRDKRIFHLRAQCGKTLPSLAVMLK